MMLAGGLLRLYWDSGRTTPPPPPPPPPPPAPDELPLGIENTARPNVNIRWGNRVDAPPPAPKPPSLEREQEATPVALPVRVACAYAAPAAAAPQARLVGLGTRAPAASANPAATAPAGVLVAVPQAVAFSACAAPGALAPQAVPEIDDQAAAAIKRRERNRRAAELALRLLDDE